MHTVFQVHRRSMPLFFALFLLMLFAPVGAQSTDVTTGLNPAHDSAEAAAFITTHFQLQMAYNTVFCVSADGTCPAEISVTPPCYLATCTADPQTYPVAATYTTLQQAVDAARPGDLVAVMPGRYAGVAVEDRGGTDGAYIHLLGMGAVGDVVVERSADPTKAYLRHHFYFINAHHFIIDNLTFTGSESGAGIFVSGYFSESGTFAHHIIVNNVYAHDHYSWGMHSTAASYVLVQDSVFTGSVDEHGLYVSGSGDHMLIRRNVFQGNNAAGVQVNPDPQTATAELFYFLQNQAGDTCGWTEDDVEFTGAAEWQDLKQCYDAQGFTPDNAADPAALYLEDGVSRHILIEQNIITGNGAAGGAGINLAAMRDSHIRNNLIYGNDAAGIACWDNAYAEEKGLASSVFGCQNTVITHNTIVDESGGRGALIINNDARDMQVFNNIIVRDRFDAYEITANAGSGLRSGGNYFSAQSVTDAPGFGGDVNSVTGFTIADALAQFVAPGFESWLSLTGDTYTLNPARPDYHLRPASPLATLGDPAYLSPADLFGQGRTAGIGALVVGALPDAAPAADDPGAAALPTEPLTLNGTVVYWVDGQVWMQHDGSTTNISAELDTLSPGEDGFVNISPDGAWLILETTRFDAECAGWSCWAVLPRDLSSAEVVRVDGVIQHTEGSSAITNDATIIIEGDAGPHDVDLFAYTRSADGWTGGVLLTGDSTEPFNREPVVSDDGTRLLYNCMIAPYSSDGSSICEVNIDGTGWRLVLAPNQPPASVPAGAELRSADYAPDGSIVFEADWTGEQIWRLLPDGTLTRLNEAFGNDNSPCVLPDGSIASLWLGRPEGDSQHELKLMSADGTQYVMLVADQDVLDFGLGCGR